MVDVWKIAEFVEAHPENHEQRWRLAKKLYLAWEYRLALEHLLILKNGWKEKLSINRYLAATFFRLKRFPEAIDSLEQAIETWPDNVDLREQLAHTLQMADKKMEASDVWKTLAEMQPEHPFALKTSEKLRREVLGDDAPEPARASSKHQGASAPAPRTFKPGAELICTNCGARNGSEFERCWQCHGTLANAFEAPPNTDTPKQAFAQSIPSTPFPWPLVGGLAVVALLTVGVYLTLRYFFPPEGAAVLSTSASVHAFLAQTLSITRMLVGVVLLIAWPISLYLSTQMVTTEEDLLQEIIVAGLFLASLFYVLTWVPMDLIYMVLVVPIVVSMVLVAVLFRKYPGRAAAVWAIQMAMVTVVVLTVVAASHGLGFIKDAPGMIAYHQERAAISPKPISGQTPLRFQLTWKSSGSDWLDEAGIKTVFSVTPGPFEGRMLFEIQDGSKTVEIREVERPLTTFDIDEIVPERPYTLLVTGPVEVEVSISIESLMNVMAVELEPDPDSS